MNNKLDLIFKKSKIFPVFFLRLGLGCAFTIHGVNKFPLPPEKLIEYFGFSPFLASFIAISEVIAGITIILGGFFKNYIGNLLTRFSALICTRNFILCEVTCTHEASPAVDLASTPLKGDGDSGFRRAILIGLRAFGEADFISVETSGLGVENEF